jgi:hypothetical protein
VILKYFIIPVALAILVEAYQDDTSAPIDDHPFGHYLNTEYLANRIFPPGTTVVIETSSSFKSSVITEDRSEDISESPIQDFGFLCEKFIKRLEQEGLSHVVSVKARYDGFTCHYENDDYNFLDFDF